MNSANANFRFLQARSDLPTGSITAQMDSQAHQNKFVLPDSILFSLLPIPFAQIHVPVDHLTHFYHSLTLASHHQATETLPKNTFFKTIHSPRQSFPLSNRRLSASDSRRTIIKPFQ